MNYSLATDNLMQFIVYKVFRAVFLLTIVVFYVGKYSLKNNGNLNAKSNRLKQREKRKITNPMKGDLYLISVESTPPKQKT